MKKLGATQIACLESLERHGGYTPGGGWVWQNHSTTIRVMQSLMHRGLTENVGSPVGSRKEHYVITDEGKALLAAKRTVRPPQHDVDEALLMMAVDGSGEWDESLGFWVKNLVYTKLCMAALVGDGFVMEQTPGKWSITGGAGFDRCNELGYKERLALYEE